MPDQQPKNINIEITTKKAVRNGLKTHAEILAKQLETTLYQIDVINTEIEVLNNLDPHQSDDLDLQDPPNNFPQPLLTDLATENHAEDE